MNPVRVLLVGADGRMGRAVRAVAASADDISLATASRGPSLRDVIAACDVVVDFSHPDATADICAACASSQKPLVSGTTGHSAAQLKLIAETAAKTAVLLAPNFSVGVNALAWLAREAVRLLGPGFDIEIVESHHRLKKDSPSGTAKRLAEVLCEARKLDYARHVTHGREGIVGERPVDQIGVHSIRGGDVVGDHTVVFAGTGERVELTHKASSRETFAAGALRAARWIVGKPPGNYSMDDVLGLRGG